MLNGREHLAQFVMQFPGQLLALGLLHIGQLARQRRGAVRAAGHCLEETRLFHLTAHFELTRLLLQGCASIRASADGW